MSLQPLQRNWSRLKGNDEEKLLEVLDRLLEPATVDLMMTNLAPAIAIAKAEKLVETRTAIIELVKEFEDSPEKTKVIKALMDLSLAGS